MRFCALVDSPQDRHPQQDGELMQPLVLYIEDDRDNMVLVRRVLRAAGFGLLEATTAREGIELALNHQPDLILMDINLPEVDGLTATRELRENPCVQHIPIVALTANIMQNVIQQALDAGCNGYIVKPIQVDKLPDHIRSYLDT